MSVETLLISIGVLMIIATVLPLLPNDAWWIRVFDFPRLQITFVTAITLIAFLAYENDLSTAKHIFVAVLFLCLLHQSYMMYPYTRLSAKQVQSSLNPHEELTFSLLFANVLMYNRNVKDLIKIIRSTDPDIILTVETDEWWQEQLQELMQTHPYAVKQPQNNTYGMLFYSRLPLIDPQIKFLVEDDIPSIHTGVKLLSGNEVELRCLHPRPPYPTESERTTERDAELLLVGKEVINKDIPVVVFGDLNDVAWSRTNNLFQNISGLLDPRIGRGFFHTFHAKIPFLRFPLDHFFHSNNLRLVDFRRLGYFGSDHFPVYIKLSYEPAAVVEQKQTQADLSQQAEANEKIQKAL